MKRCLLKKALQEVSKLAATLHQPENRARASLAVENTTLARLKQELQQEGAKERELGELGRKNFQGEELLRRTEDRGGIHVPETDLPQGKGGAGSAGSIAIQRNEQV